MTTNTTFNTTATPGRGNRYEDLHAHPILYFLMVCGILGMGADSVLIQGVIASSLSVHDYVAWTIAVIFGLAASGMAIEAGTLMAHGRRKLAALPIVGVLVMGGGLALTRLATGLQGAAASTDASRPMMGAESGPDWSEHAVTALLLGMFLASAITLTLISWKLFNPTRHALRRFSADRDRVIRALTPLEADLARIKEWMAFRPAHRAILKGLKGDALDSVVHREAFLKQYARECMVEALGSQTSPIVRAPLEPNAGSSSTSQDA